MAVALAVAAVPLMGGAGAKITERDHEIKFTSQDTAAHDRFGRSVSVSGDRVLAGAPLDDAGSSDSGAAYLFAPDGAGGWDETKFTAGDSGKNARYGSSVAISDGTLVVGAPLDDNGNGQDAGAAYVYEPDGAGGFVETKVTASDGAASDEFGSSVAISDGTLVVGAPLDDNGNGQDAGAAYVYEPDGAGGFVETKVTASDGAASDEFGHDVANDGGLFLVGVPRANQDDGAAYLYRSDASGGLSEAKITASDPDGTDLFGESVDASGGHLFAGAPRNDEQGPDAGAAYLHLAPPRNPAASPGPGIGEITIEWDAPTGSSQNLTYHVYRSNTSGGPYTEIANTTDLDHTDTGLGDQPYHYVVTAEGVDGLESPFSNEVSSTPEAPPAPENLSAVAASTGGAVNLTWDAPSGTNRSFTYNVQRADTSGGPYTEIAATTNLTYVDTGLSHRTYHYVVTAETDAGLESDHSNEASATPRLTAPQNLTASEGDQGGEIDLYWDPPTGSTVPTAYRVYRSTESGSPYEFVDETSDTAYTDGGLDADTYYYVVTAVDDRGRDSPFSNEASAEPAPGSGTPDPEDEAQDDAGTGGDASDDRIDPTILTGEGTIPINGTLVPVIDVVDAYGTRIAPNQTRSMTFTFEASPGQEIRVSLYRPNGTQVDTDTTVQGDPAQVSVSAGPNDFLAEGVWVTVLEVEGPAPPAFTLGSGGATHGLETADDPSTWGRLQGTQPVSQTGPVWPLAGTSTSGITLQFSYGGDRRCEPNC